MNSLDIIIIRSYIVIIDNLIFRYVIEHGWERYSDGFEELINKYKQT